MHSQVVLKALSLITSINYFDSLFIGQINGDSVSVRYIDFGNTETRGKADLKPLDHEFLTQPISVFKCKLHGKYKIWHHII